MRAANGNLSASEAARSLGVSPKALRLYEQCGLVTPLRSEAGWRTFGPAQMARAAEIVALRAFGLSLSQVARILNGDRKDLEAALAAHQGVLDTQLAALTETIARVGRMRMQLSRGLTPTTEQLRQTLTRQAPRVAFDLPWPWAGEPFELRDIRPLTFIVGPLGSGKTRLAREIASAIPGGRFLELERAHRIAEILERKANDAALAAKIDHALGWLADDGAALSDALHVLIAALEDDEPSAIVADLVEEGLDQATQEALIAYLRRREVDRAPLFLMTRSSAILDLAAVRPTEMIILCPANHAPPSVVAPYPGTTGYEAVETCLATPEVRARTSGTIAWRPVVA